MNVTDSQPVQMANWTRPQYPLTPPLQISSAKLTFIPLRFNDAENVKGWHNEVAWFSFFVTEPNVCPNLQ